MGGFQSVQIFPGFDGKGFICLAVAVGFSCSDMKTGLQSEGKADLTDLPIYLTPLTVLQIFMVFKSRVSLIAKWEGWVGTNTKPYLLYSFLVSFEKVFSFSD